MSITLGGSSYLTKARSGATAGRTLFAWIKPANDSQAAVCFGMGQASADNAVTGGMATFKARVNSLGSGGGSGAGSVNDIVASAWRALMITWSADDNRAVIYGSATSSVSDTFGVGMVTANFDRLVVGAHPKDLSALFTGDIAEVTEWASVLSDANFVTLTGDVLPESVSSGTLVENFPLLASGSYTGSAGGVLVPSGTITTGATHPITRVSTSAALTGTLASGAVEADIVAGGKTIILTLTGDTWVSSGATFNAQRQNIINGIDSAQAEATGWDAVVKALQGVSGVVRTSNTVVTITLDAQATYNITANETITATIPGSALTGGSPIVASPTVTITAAAGGSGMVSKVIQQGA